MHPVSRIILDRRYWLLPLAVWTTVVVASMIWSWRDLERHAYDVALNRAQFIFKMVESVRLWNARHGGVYAEIDAQTPPKTPIWKYRKYRNATSQHLPAVSSPWSIRPT